jgi:hypothetical protein
MSEGEHWHCGGQFCQLRSKVVADIGGESEQTLTGGKRETELCGVEQRLQVMGRVGGVRSVMEEAAPGLSVRYRPLMDHILPSPEEGTVQVHITVDPSRGRTTGQLPTGQIPPSSMSLTVGLVLRQVNIEGIGSGVRSET